MFEHRLARIVHEEKVQHYERLAQQKLNGNQVKTSRWAERFSTTGWTFSFENMIKTIPVPEVRQYLLGK